MPTVTATTNASAISSNLGRMAATCSSSTRWKAWGPGYLGFGLGLMSDNKGDSRFGLRATYDQTWINPLGAEFGAELTLGNAPNLQTEFYQPLSLDRAAFVALSGLWQARTVSFSTTSGSRATT